MSRLPGTFDKALCLERHQKMLEYQEQIAPFTPTIRELQELWGLSSTSVTLTTLRYLVGMRHVITRRHGKLDRYYAVRTQNSDDFCTEEDRVSR
jgi:hypothetical protein